MATMEPHSTSAAGDRPGPAAWAAGRLEAIADPDDPQQLDGLTTAERAALAAWIAEALRPSAQPGPLGSYALKAAAEAHLGGSLPHGAFVGALSDAGYLPAGPGARKDWRFAYAPAPAYWRRAARWVWPWEAEAVAQELWWECRRAARGRAPRGRRRRGERERG